jgi:predicted PurR-regulated permease PerM
MAEHNKNNVTFSISNGSIVRVILFGLLLVALYYLRDLILVILTAIVIATFIDAAARRLSRWRINRTLSVVIIYILGLALLAGIFYIFVPLLVVETSNLISLLSKYLPTSDLIQNLQTQQQALGAKELANSFTHTGGSLSSLVANAKLFVSNLSSGFFDAISSAFGGILNVVIIVVISFYLSIQEKGIEKFLRIVTPDKSEAYVINLWQRTQRKIALWVKGQLILGLIVGVLIYLGLAILGVQYALVLAIAAAILELIPFGILLATVPAVSFAYIDGGVTLALLVAGLYLIVQQFESYLIQPLVIKKVIGISPLVVILSVLIGAKLAGFWGLILAIPVAVALLELADDVEKDKVLSRTE